MKKMKKVLSLVLALALVFGLSATAFAANSETQSGSITISGAIANEQYTIYQIFELTYSDDINVSGDWSSYSYKVNNDWVNFLSTQTTVVAGQEVSLFNLTENNYLDPDSLIFQAEELGVDMAALAQAALSYAESTNINGTSASFAWNESLNAYVVTGGATIENTYTDDYGYVYADLTFSGLSLGYYLVDTSLGSLCMLTSTDPDATVNEKNSTPTISKWVYNSEDEDLESEDHENNNTRVIYELEVDHITGAVNLVIHDSQPSELEEDWENFSPYVFLVDNSSYVQLTVDEDYVINLTGAVDDNVNCSDEEFNNEYGCTFEIDLSAYDFSNVSDDAYIEVIYSATLNTEGDIYADDIDEIDNFAVVTFGSNSTSPVVEAEVYSFGFEVFKYTDAADDGLDVITIPVYNDSPAGQQDYLYLALVDLVNNEETVTYYAEFTEVEGYENTYYITGLIEANRVYAIQDQPFEILGYLDDSGAVVELSYVTEPDASVTEDNPITLTFFYDGALPEHDYIVLDEFGTAQSEDDQGSDDYMYGAVSNALAGAEFSLTNEDDEIAYFEEETIDLTDEDGNLTGLTKHIYLFEGWVESVDDVPEGYTTVLTSDTTGYINIEGLNTGLYTLTETKAPDGYNMLDESIYVTIWAEYDGTSGAVTDHGVTWTLGESETTNTGVVEVINNAGNELPGTGGIGTTWFYIIGAILVVGAAVVLVTRRRVNAKAA